MGYRKKIYDTGFEIIKKWRGWDLAIWKDCLPNALVLMRPLNDKDFIFADIGSSPFNDSNIPYMLWYSCINGTFQEITADEAQKLWNGFWEEKKKSLPCKKGDTVYLYPKENWIDDGIVADIQYIDGNIKIRVNTSKVDNLCFSPYEFGYSIFMTQQERDAVVDATENIVNYGHYPEHNDFKEEDTNGKSNCNSL